MLWIEMRHIANARHDTVISISLDMVRDPHCGRTLCHEDVIANLPHRFPYDMLPKQR